jgi:hypothetical protein
MLLKRLSVLALLVSMSSGRVARGDDLEPETGTFGGYGPTEPYELLLRRALFEDDHYRLCQFVVMPSFAAEFAVYILAPEKGPPVVVSRTLKQQLWSSMMDEMMKACPSGSVQLDAMSQSVALEKLRPMTETHRAELTPKAAAALGLACEGVLLRVRYSKNTSLGLDGTTYHAGHWIPGAFLSGTTWSPEAGTVAREFVDMGEQLKVYAESQPAKRAQVEADLIAKATHLTRRLGSTR